MSPEKRLLAVEALSQTEAARKYGRAPPTIHGTRAASVSGRCAEDVKIMVMAFLAERGVQANSKAWHNAMQSEHIQRMTIAHEQSEEGASATRDRAIELLVSMVVSCT